MKYLRFYTIFILRIVALLILPLILYSCKDSPPNTTTPNVEVIYPKNNSTIVDTTTIEVLAVDDKGIAQVEIYIDNKLDSNRIFFVKPYRYIWDATNEQDSSGHIIYAKAYDTDGNVAGSNVVLVTVLKFAPSNLQVITITASYAILSWQDNSKNVTLFEIEQSNDSVNFVKVAEVPSNTISDTLYSTFEPGINYYFRVRAKRDTVFSCYSNIAYGFVPKNEWMMFTTSNSQLASNYIHCISMDSAGAMWFGTDSGASKYTSGQWTNIKDSLGWIVYYPTRTHYKVIAIAEGKGGILWFGLAGGGLRAFNPYKTSDSFKTWKRFDFSGNVIDAVAARNSSDGVVWISVNNGGVYRYIPPSLPTDDPLDGYFVQESSDKFRSNLVRCITINPVNDWVFFGAPEGVAYVNTQTSPWSWSFHDLLPGYVSPVYSLAVDYSNTIWAGKFYGVTEYNPGTAVENNYTPANTGNILPDAYINATATNLYNIRWFGTSVGLVQFKDTIWSIYTVTDYPLLPSNNIQSLCYDRKGNLWIGTDKGLAIFNEKGIRF